MIGWGHYLVSADFFEVASRILKAIDVNGLYLSHDLQILFNIRYIYFIKVTKIIFYVVKTETHFSNVYSLYIRKISICKPRLRVEYISEET